MAFSHDWFTSNIPVWERLFAPLKGRDGLRMLEIGSFEGRATCWLLGHVLTGQGACIECIDPFTGNREHAEQGIPFDNRLQEFRENTAPWRDRVTAHIGESGQVLPGLQGLFDAVYIDGSHSARDVLNDAVWSWRLLKDGGLMIFDDYQWDFYPQPEFNPRLAVDSFLQCYLGWYEVAHVGYQVAVSKRSTYRDPRKPA